MAGRVTRSALGALFLLLLLLLPGGALRADYSEAEKAYSMGRMLVDMGDHAGGVFELKKAVAIMPLPRYLEALIEAYRAAGQEDAALLWGVYYQESTREDRRSVDLNTWVDQARERLVSRLCLLTVKTDPKDARLKVTYDTGVEGQPFQDIPGKGRQVLLDPGQVLLVASHETRKEEQRRLVAEGGKRLDLDLTLQRPEGVGTLTVTASEPGAVVLLDGADAGKAPLQKELKSGRYLVQVWASDHAEWSGFVEIMPGRTAELTVTLKRAPGASLAQSKPLKVEGGGGMSLATWGWICSGLGVALLGGGGYTYSVVFSKTDEMNKLKKSATKQRADLQAQVDSYFLYTMILGGAGVAALGGGITMILLDDGEGGSDGESLQLLSVAPVLTPDAFVLEAGFGF
jgi:hypothetical protein